MMIRALIASQALGNSKRGGPLCIARNSAALFAWSDRFMASPSNSRAAGNPRAQTADRQAWTGGGNADIGNAVTGSAHGTAAGVVGICLVVVPLFAPSGGEANEGAAARLTRALAAEEAHDGSTSPYLLPLIEELAQAQRRA